MPAFCVVSLFVLLASTPAAVGEAYFQIRVVDEETGRGVPLVELETVNNLRYVTDSAGRVAFFEPGLMNQDVFFHVKSHGYEFPRDGFGYRGTALKTTPGQAAELKIRRVNIAQRLYRITGAGIYRDSVLLGEPTPIRQPVLNGLVIGSDSVINATFGGKLYWFWGDTNRPAYPLGNFHTTGATSPLPPHAGCDPERGIDLNYFVNDDGFVRPMAAMPGDGPTWLDGVATLRGGSGRERMFGFYGKVKPPLEIYRRGLAEFNAETQRFEHVREWSLDGPIVPEGHTLVHADMGREFVHFVKPLPLVRVPADPESFMNPGQYEAFSCLKEGTAVDDFQPDVLPDGAVRYAWKKNTPPLNPTDQAKWIARGTIPRSSGLIQLQDARTGATVRAHNDSVFWNAWRARFVMVFAQWHGSSELGETWYAEADSPVGPWVYAVKIVTHDKYSFYNPKQHPLFDQAGGREIYFEGTYTNSFSGNAEQTPRYDYNQILYKLDLADPRLVLPVPVYRVRNERGEQLRTGGEPPVPDQWGDGIAFFACDRPGSGWVAVFEDAAAEGRPMLDVRVPAANAPPPLFYALPHDAAEPPPTAVPLYEYVSPINGRRLYAIDAARRQPGFERRPRPLCLVWKNPYHLTAAKAAQ